MITFTIVRKRAVKMPEFRWSRDFWNKVGKVVEGSTLDMIRKQTTMDGSRIKTNAPSTRERKRRAGRPLLSLVDKEHRFVRGGQQSWKIIRYLPRNTGIAVAAATRELAELVHHVVEMGYTGWLGLSQSAVGAVRALIREEMRRMFREAAKGRR